MATTSTPRTSRPRPLPRRCGPRPRRGPGLSPSGSASDQSARRRGRPTTRAWPSTTLRRRGPAAGEATRPRAAARSRAAAGDGPGDGVLAGVLDRADQAQQVVPVDAGGGVDADQAHHAGRDRAGLVEDHRVDLCGSTQDPGLMMRSRAAAPAGPDEQGRGGVASPRAQGQAMISTETAAVKVKWSPRTVAEPVRSRVPTASAMTTGTKTLATWSASRWLGALPIWAVPTSRAIWASWVSAPTRVAATTRPAGVDGGAGDRVPGTDLDGHGSPVSRAASMADALFDHPSVATFSPGRTTKRSPRRQVVGGDADLDAVPEDGGVLGAHVESRGLAARRRSGAFAGPGRSARRG